MDKGGKRVQYRVQTKAEIHTEEEIVDDASLEHNT